MKKISLLLATVLLVIFVATPVFASGILGANSGESVTYVESNDSNEKLSQASKTTQRNLTAKEEEIQKYMKSRNDGGLELNRGNATVLYYLHLIQLYSYPVCFVGLAIASLNFFIIQVPSN